MEITQLANFNPLQHKLTYYMYVLYLHVYLQVQCLINISGDAVKLYILTVSTEPT